MWASDWSRLVCRLKNDTDIVEQRWIAQNSLKKLSKNGHFGVPEVNFKSPQNHTIWGSFESSWALENDKNNEKNCASKSGRLGIFGAKIRKKRPRKAKLGSIESSWAQKHGENVKKIFKEINDPEWTLKHHE